MGNQKIISPIVMTIMTWDNSSSRLLLKIKDLTIIS